MKDNKKSFLAAISGLSLVASLGAHDATAVGIVADNFVVNNAPYGDPISGVGIAPEWRTNRNLRYDGNFTGVTGNITNLVIRDIHTRSRAPGVFTFIDTAGDGVKVTIGRRITTNFSGGKAVGGLLPIELFDNSEIIFDANGNNYRGLGSVDGINANNGLVTFKGENIICDADIGQNNSIKEIKLNSSGSLVTLGGDITSGKITIIDADTIKLNGITTSEMSFQANAEVNVNKQFIGNIDFEGNEAVINLSDSAQIIGNINSSGSLKGTLNLFGSSTIDGVVGATNLIDNINALGTGVINLGSGKNVTANNLSIQSSDINVNIGGTLASNVEFSAGGTLNLNGDMTGDIDFKANNGEVNLADTKTIIGNIDSSTGNAGALNISGSGVINGIVGATNALNEINVNGNGVVAFNKGVKSINLNIKDAGSDVTTSDMLSSNVEFSAGGTLNLNGDMTGDIDFGLQGGLVNVADAKIINTTSIINGSSASIRFLGDGSLALGASNKADIGKIIAGEAGKNVTLSAGDYIGEVQLNNSSGIININDNFKIIGGLNSTGGSDGNVNFLGNAVIEGVLGSALNPLGAVVISGKDAVLELLSDVNADSIDSSVLDNQHLRFSNLSDVEVNSEIGANTPLQTIELSSASQVRFNSGLNTETLDFTTDGSIIVNSDLGATNITNSKGSTNSLISINTSQNLMGNIAGFGNMQMNGDQTIDLQTINYDLSGLNLTTQVSNEGTIIINRSYAASDIMTLGYIGALVKQFKLLNFCEDGRVGDVYSNNLIIKTDKKAYFDGVVNVSNGIKLQGADSEGHFSSASLNADLLSDNVSGNGRVYFNNTDITKKVGSPSLKLNEVNFIEPSSESNISSDLHANNININNAKLTLLSESVFDGVTNASDAILNIAEHDLIFQTGDSVVQESMICIDANSGEAGNLVASSGASLSLQGNINIDIKQFSTLPPNDTELLLIRKNSSGELNLSAAIINITNSGGAFVNWENEISSNHLKLVAKTDVAQVISSGGTNSDVAEAFANFEPGTPGEGTINLLNSLSPENVQEGVSRIVNTTSEEVTQHKVGMSYDITNQLNHRIDGTRIYEQVDFEDVAPSSGDRDSMYGIWASPFYSKTIKNAENNFSGYSSNSYGGIVGFDGKVDDQVILGASFAYSNAQIKHKNDKSGDRTKINSYMFSGYANIDLNKDWFLRGLITVGVSDVDNKERRVISDTEYGIANGHYRAKLFTTEARLAKEYKFNNDSVITPALGASFTAIRDDSYQETGVAPTPLRSHAQKTREKFDIIASLKFESNKFDIRGIELIPEIHGSVRYDLIGDKDVIARTIEGLELPDDTEHKAHQFYGNLGFAIKAYKNDVEYGAIINSAFARRYRSIGGSLNIRVNF
ncbi:MAG: hypothetical protein DGJ47_001027 [Rickettsiaceae bacterium]